MANDLVQSERSTETRRDVCARRAAFTLVELLIVIAIILILLSLLIVGLNAATKTAQRARSGSLMTAISQGLVRFKEDVGYYPPVLGPGMGSYASSAGRQLMPPPVPDAPPADFQDWYSVTTLAEYLVGYGTHRDDGYGYVPGEPPIFDWDREQPALGFRNPGVDGVWGAGTGTLNQRMLGSSGYGSESAPYQFDQGRVYGPYIEVDDPRLLGSLDDDGEIHFPGDDDYAEPQTDGSNPKVLCDYWGNPIQYFRRPYPLGALTQSYRAGAVPGGGPVPTLSNVIRLRPYAVSPGAAADVDSDFADLRGDTTTSMSLQTGEFALFSQGGDRTHDRDYRVDDEEANRDNIVEVGP